MLIGLPSFLSNLPATNMTRLVWHSESDKKRFGSQVSAFSDAWLEAEQMSVLEGIRPLCLQPMPQHEYLAFLPWAHDNGLHVRVKRFAGAFQGFSHYYTEGTDILVVAMSRDRDMVEDEHPEKYLGYPDCCQTFFASNFPKYIDPVLQWANYEDSVRSSSTCVPVLRPLGLRFVPHIPCAPDCRRTEELGDRLALLLPDTLREAGREILSSPISWDCYRGIAIVKTPWFRTVYRSVPYKDRVVIKINEP